MSKIKHNNSPSLSLQERNTQQFTLQSSGDGVQQIAYAENVNTNNIIVINGPSVKLKNGFRIPETVGKSNDCYHLVVVDDEALVENSLLLTLKISTADALMKYTPSSLMNHYARLGKTEIKELISYPALFVYKKENKEKCNATINAHFGVIYDIKKNRDYILLECMLYTHFCRDRLKALYKQLEINDSYFVDELCVEHWALKERDLLEILHAAYIPVGFSNI